MSISGVTEAAALPAALPEQVSGTRPIQGRIASIDFLRGLAALAVVFFHIWPDPRAIPGISPFWVVFSQFTRFTSYGWCLFFLLSGFCIHLPSTRRIQASGHANIDFAGFWKRRVHRLYPPYLVMLLLTMPREIYSAWRGTVLLFPQPQLPWAAGDFVTHLFMLHGFHPYFDHSAGNGVYWSLAREEYLYLLYFPLLMMRRKVGVFYGVGVTLLIGVVFPLFFQGWLPPQSPWWQTINSSALALWIQWSLGVLAVEWCQGMVKLPRWFTDVRLLPVWLIAAVSMDHSNLIYSAIPALDAFFYGMVCFLLIITCVRMELDGKWKGTGLVKLITHIGLFSYSLYLVNVPVVFLMEKILPPSRFHALGLPNLVPVLYLTMGMAACVGCGWLYFWLVERHFLNRPQAAKGA